MQKALYFLFIGFFIHVILSAQTTVKGTVTGYDGKPMKMANVVLTELPDYVGVKSVIADSNGLFSITVDTAGIWMLRFSGVSHKSHVMALYVAEPETITVNIQLGTYDYVKDFSGAKVTGNFNNWYPLSAVPMQKQSDGTYVVEIETSLDSVIYQLKYVRDAGDIEGTQADKYVTNKSESYHSVVAVKNNKAKIIFDTQKLSPSNQLLKIAFVNTDSSAIKFSSYFDEFQRYQNSYQSAFNAFMQSRGRMGKFEFDLSGITTFLKKHLQEETDDALLKELHILYLAVAVNNKLNDNSNYQSALEKISPSSPLWLLNPHHIYYALNHSGYSEQKQDEYVQQVLKSNPVSRVKTAVLFDEFHAAKYSGQEEKATMYYEMLISQYGNTPEAAQVKKLFPHQLDLMIGRPVPKFSAISMDDSTKIFTNEFFKGKYTLLHFWASAYKPAADEISQLQKVYKKYRAKNFEILSFSVDTTQQQVLNFRKAKQKMPWRHSFLGAELENKVVRDFQVNAIPKYFLIDQNGNLAATGNKLSEIALEEKLKN